MNADQPEPPKFITRTFVLKTGLIAVSQNKINRAVQPVFGFTLAEPEKPKAEGVELECDEQTEPAFILSEKYKK